MKVYSIKLDAGQLRDLKRAAARLGVKPAVLARDAVSRAVSEALGKCPQCGRAHKATEAGAA